MMAHDISFEAEAGETVRHATLFDLQALTAIERACFPQRKLQTNRPS